MSNDTHGTLTPRRALALQAILGAAQRKTTVGRLFRNPDCVQIGQAWRIGLADEHAADSHLDIRDLFLIVRLNTGCGTHAVTGWRIRDLLDEYPTGHFMTDFNMDAFEAAGGQAAVPAQVREYEGSQAHKAHPKRGTVYDRDDDPVTHGTLPARFPLYGDCERCGQPTRCYDITADWGHDSEFQPAYRFAHPVTPAERFLMRQARAWIAESFGPDDFGDRELGDLEDPEVYGGVAAHFDGGWAAFMRAEFHAPGRYPAMAYVRNGGASLLDVVVVPSADSWVELALSLPAGQEVWQG